MAITSAIVAITPVTQQHMAITSAKPGNKICQRNTTPTMWHNISHSSIIGAINNKNNGITSAKHGNNICQQQSGNNISHRMAKTSANMVPLINKIMAITLAKIWLKHLPITKSGNSISHKKWQQHQPTLAITSANINSGNNISHKWQ